MMICGSLILITFSLYSVNYSIVDLIVENTTRRLVIIILTWSGFEAAKTAPWLSWGLHHCGKFLEPSDE